MTTILRGNDITKTEDSFFPNLFDDLNVSSSLNTDNISSPSGTIVFNPGPTGALIMGPGFPPATSDIICDQLNWTNLTPKVPVVIVRNVGSGTSLDISGQFNYNLYDSFQIVLNMTCSANDNLRMAYSLDGGANYLVASQALTYSKCSTNTQWFTYNRWLGGAGPVFNLAPSIVSNSQMMAKIEIMKPLNNTSQTINLENFFTHQVDGSVNQEGFLTHFSLSQTVLITNLRFTTSSGTSTLSWNYSIVGYPISP